MKNKRSNDERQAGRGNLGQVKGVVFDFDGTIVSIHIDFRGIKEILLESALKSGLRVVDKEKPILELLDSISRENPGNRSVRGFISGIKKILLEEEMKSACLACPLPGSIKLMENLRDRGIKIAIFTRNCRQAVMSVVEKCSIPHDVIVTRDDVSRVKPDKEHLSRVASLLELKENEIIVAGDHPMDIRSARNFNALSCGLVSGTACRKDFEREGADFVFDSIEDMGYLFGIKPLMPGKLPNPLLGYLLKRYTEYDKSVISGPQTGVDCAVFRTDGKVLLAKSDPVTLVGKDMGTYLLSVNMNDISVMGGIARWFLCSLIFRPGITFSEVEDIFSQVGKGCRQYGINWVGGHTEISGSARNNIACGFLSGTMGKKKKGSGSPAREGDSIFLVGQVGIEAVSIIAREKGGRLAEYFSPGEISRMSNALENPGINVSGAARLIWENFRVKAMHDPTEGGISAALIEISERFGIGISVKKKSLVFHPGLSKLCSIFGLNPLGIISSGCLVGIVDSKEGAGLLSFLKKKGFRAAIIGVAAGRQGVLLEERGRQVPFPVFERDEITRL